MQTFSCSDWKLSTQARRNVTPHQTHATKAFTLFISFSSSSLRLISRLTSNPNETPCMASISTVTPKPISCPTHEHTRNEVPPRERQRRRKMRQKILTKRSAAFAAHACSEVLTVVRERNTTAATTCSVWTSDALAIWCADQCAQAAFDLGLICRSIS